MQKKLILFLFFNFSFLIFLSAQPDRWQQRVKYKMNVDVNVNTNLIDGTENLEYSNNSPDKLDRVFFHLYWNAFQPGSEMDVRSRAAGIRHRFDRAKVVLTSRAGQKTAKALEVSIELAPVRSIRQVNSQAVGLPKLNRRVPYGIAFGVQ